MLNSLEIKRLAKFSPIPIIVTTFERLEYLKRCVWSIVASTKVPYQIVVADDGSQDGTKPFLQHMLERGLIHKVIWNDKIGTARQFNGAIEQTTGKFFVIANDDMYFHRGWDAAVFRLLMREKKIGTITFYNYTRTGSSGVFNQEHRDHYVIGGTGLGAALINRKGWEDAGKFILPDGKRMGFFAGTFCTRMGKNGLRHLVTAPFFADHMDLPTSRLNERPYLSKYLLFRQQVKK